MCNISKYLSFLRLSGLSLVLLLLPIITKSQKVSDENSKFQLQEQPSGVWKNYFGDVGNTEADCPCFSEKMLDSLFHFSWKEGWWSDVPGCKLPPHHEMLEIYIVNMGLPKYDLNFTAQAGKVDGAPFVSSNLYNNRTKKFEWRYDGYPDDSIATPCTRILRNYIKKLSVRFPDMNYCGNDSSLSNNTLELYTPPPVWKTPGYMIALGILLASLVYTIILLFVRKKYEAGKLRLKETEMQLEKEKLLLDERRRFAMELHDDVGTELTTIVYLSQLAESNKDEVSKNEQVRKIGDQSRNLIQKMSEIIWALNAENDTTDKIAAYLRKMAAELLTEHKIEFNSVIGEIEGKPIISVYRRNILLIVKEILHNIIKYANAARVEMEFFTKDDKFTIVIKEQGGNGFDPDEVQKGNGLLNIEKRAKASGISYKFIRDENGMLTILQI